MTETLAGPVLMLVDIIQRSVFEAFSLEDVELYRFCLIEVAFKKKTKCVCTRLNNRNM